MTIDNLNNSATPVTKKLLMLFEEILEHDGFGEIRVEVNILKRKQKEVILHCGKQYRFVVDTHYKEKTECEAGSRLAVK